MCLFTPNDVVLVAPVERSFEKAQSKDFRFMLNVMIKCYNRFHILISTNVHEIKTSLADVYGGANSRLRGSESKKLLIEVENYRRNVIGWEVSSKTYGWDGFSALRSNGSVD